MKRVIIFAILAVLLSPAFVLGASLQVEKMVDKSSISVGDSVKVLLKFTNPFGKEVPIRIVDKNVFGNNGIDIQCLEHTLPSKKETVLAYDPITPFAPGTYTLGEAQVTYTNPDTGKEETVKSNTLEVKVSGSAKQGQVQGITTIYNCGGVSMRSTSYSTSGSSFNIQIGSSQSSQSFGQRASSGSVQNNQMNQDMSALKQEMQRQIQEQKKMKQEFQQNLMRSQKFQEIAKNLTRMGYNLTGISSNPQTNNTGSFEASFRKPNGETATVKGEMESGTLKKVSTLTAEDKKRILEKLFKNPKFQEYDKKLRSHGFNMSQPVFQLSENKTEVSIPYMTESEENKIMAEYENGTIKNVSLDKELKEENPWPWIILFVVVVLAVLFAYKKLKKTKELKKEPQKQVTKKERKIDWRKEARKMIVEAKRLYSEGKEKDAYEKVSQAVRLYFSWKLGLKKEITSGELLKEMRRRKVKELGDVQRCLNLCGLVEFAKYRPNRKDFNEIIKMAEELIKNT